MDVLEERKGEGIMLLDLRPEAIIADFFVLCNGTSDRQLKALVDYVREGVKEQFGKLPSSVEGTGESGWVLMDYGDTIIHLFSPEKRRYYDLEGLWRAEASILLNIQ